VDFEKKDQQNFQIFFDKALYWVPPNARAGGSVAERPFVEDEEK